MKKLLSLLMILTLVVSMFALGSCDNNGDGNPDADAKTLETLDGQTPEQIYEASMEALKSATCYEVTTVQVIKMSVQGQSVTMNQTVTAKIDGDNSYAKLTNDMYSMYTEAWYVDGVVYANDGTSKLKTNITKEEYMQQYMNSDPSESTLLDIPESWFEDIRFSDKDGVYSIDFEVSGDEYNQLLENVGLGAANINGNVTYSVFFDEDGNLSRIETVFGMDFSGVSAECVSTSYVTLTDVTITPPADADSYTLVGLN